MDSPIQNRQRDAGSTERETSGNSGAISDRPVIRQALRELLSSTPFRSSKQCQDLLRYVVEHSLVGSDDLLRERVIGNAVFGRAPNYDAANDPIVRARMAEVRKRLAQYYLGEGRNVAGRIEIPAGSYRIHFETLAPIESVSPPEQATRTSSPDVTDPRAVRASSASNRKGWRALWISTASLIVGVACGLVWFAPHFSQQRMLNHFWGPALHSPMPVLIYTGTNVVYRFTPSFLDRYRQTHHLENVGPEFVVELPSVKTIDPSDLSASSKTFVSVGDVSACSAIITMLARQGKDYEMRYAGDISAGDVHSGPTVLIGAFNNSWTLDVTRSMRFAFVRGDTIEDRFHHGRSWSVRTNNGTTFDDYAIISRVLSPTTGGVMLTAAGIGQYGTQAASEYLTNPLRISEFAHNAPKNWSDKNVQIVLHIKVVDDAPGPVDVVDTYFW